MSDAPVLKTTPVDNINFPSTNQVHHCWQRYNEFVLCVRKNGGDEAACPQQRQYAMSICPNDWIENWDEQRQKGNFLGVQPNAKAGHHGHHSHH